MNSHYITHTFDLEWLGEFVLSLGVKGLICGRGSRSVFVCLCKHHLCLSLRIQTLVKSKGMREVNQSIEQTKQKTRKTMKCSSVTLFCLKFNI